MENPKDFKRADAAKTVNEIEKAVYAELKPQGFRKFGRTLHRFVSKDISQVIDFQIGSPTGSLREKMCVNVGIRIPECEEMTFHPETSKKYYHEYECTIRSRLGAENHRDGTWYDLAKDIKTITANIIAEIEDKVIPAFDGMSNREAIAEYRIEYPIFDISHSDFNDFCRAMIYGHLGNMEKAKELFEAHYQEQVDEYNDSMINGTKYYLKKGESISYMRQNITAEQDGYVTVYGAGHDVIDRLDELAYKLGLR